MTVASGVGPPEPLIIAQSCIFAGANDAGKRILFLNPLVCLLHCVFFWFLAHSSPLLLLKIKKKEVAHRGFTEIAVFGNNSNATANSNY